MTAPLELDGIRKATLADIPAGLALAEAAYPGRGVEKAAKWAEWCINNPDRLVLVSPKGVGIAQVSWNYGFELKGRLDLLYVAKGSGLEALKMLRIMVAWAKAKGAVGSFAVDADTGVDFGPFVKRLGGTQTKGVRYLIPL